MEVMDDLYDPFVSEYRFVDHNRYCPSCYYKKVDASERPCQECLKNLVKLHSDKPIHYKEYYLDHDYLENP